jgi:hypothetical protein
MGHSPAHQNPDPSAQAPAAADATQPGEAAAQPFAPTQIDDDAEHANDWWPESADGQCSESAALFAASQPAPLSIV